MQISGGSSLAGLAKAGLRKVGRIGTDSAVMLGGAAVLGAVAGAISGKDKSVVPNNIMETIFHEI